MRSPDGRSTRLWSGTPSVVTFLHARLVQTKKANILGILKCMETPPLADPATLRDAGVPLLVAYGDTNDLWDPEVHENFARQLHARTAVYCRTKMSPHR